MRRTSHKLSLMFILILLGLISIVSVVYAVLQDRLYINVKTMTQSELTFDVGFDTTPLTVVPSNANLDECSNSQITITKTSVKINQISLPTKDAACSYQLIIKNNGNMNAKISAITSIKPEGETCTTNGSVMTCNHIEYSIKERYAESGDNTTINTGDIIQPGKSRTVWFNIKVVGISDNSDEPENDINQVDGGFTITYSGY